MSKQMLELADELHTFIAAAPNEYPGHLVELFERIEQALRLSAVSAHPPASVRDDGASPKGRMVKLLSCPFCNEEPSFTDVELKDERRYAEKLLRCCSIEMSATLSFGQYRGLTDAQIDHQLRSELIKSWNTRAEPQASAESETPVAFRWKHPNEPRWKFSEANPQYPDYSPDIVEPLYTRPAPSASVREALELALGAFHEQGIADRVPVTLGRIERALAALSEPALAPDRDADLPTANDVRGILGPAPVNLPQSASEWCQPTDRGQPTPRKFMIYFDDPDHGIMVFDDEAEARKAFEAKNTAWSCYLFGTLPRRCQADSSPRAMPTREQIEAAAKIVYDAMPFDGAGGRTKPAWVPFGNSTRQFEARTAASAILALRCQAVNVEKDALDRIAKFATSAEMQASVDEDCARSEFARSWHATAELADFRSGYDECINIARSVSLTRPERAKDSK